MGIVKDRDVQTHFIAGAWAGLLSKAVLHPLDLAKIRMQASKSANRVNMATAMMDFKGDRSLIRVIYTGLMPNLVAESVSMGLYFGLYHITKKWNDAEGSSSSCLSCGLMAGGITQVLTNPLWIVKTRVQTDPSGKLKGLACVRGILREEGIVGFYHGMTPALLLVFNGAAHMWVYENIRARYKQYLDEFSGLHFLGMGALSKIISSSALYPLQVIRTRMYQPQNRLSILQTVSSVYTKQGLFGFFRGYSAQMLKTIPSSALTLFVLEHTLKLLDVAWI